MQECVVCGESAKAACDECGDGFCGARCFTKVQHAYQCPLIEARKRKPKPIQRDPEGEEEEEEEEEQRVVRQRRGHGLCEGDSDPFTLDDFSDIPEDEIIVLDGKCFHLPSLYNWIIIGGNARNPMTNIPFSLEDIERIREAGNSGAFRLQVNFKELTGAQKTFYTSKLGTLEALILQLFPEWDNTRTDTVYQFLMAKIDAGVRFAIALDTGSVGALDVLERMGAEQINLRVAANTLNVYVVRRYGGGGPLGSIAMYEQAVRIAQARNLPTRTFEDRIVEMRRFMREMERQRERQEELARIIPPAYVPTAEDDQNRTPGTIKVGFKVEHQVGEVNVGRLRGVDYLYVAPERTIGWALRQLRAIFNAQGLRAYFPDPVRSILYDGQGFDLIPQETYRNTRFEELVAQGRFVDGMVFYILG